MKYLASKTLVIAFATAVVLVSVPSAHGDQENGCSNATLNGGYGFTTTGATFDTGPTFSGTFGGIGRQSFDGRGNTSGTQTVSLNGNILRLTFAGTYKVNPDCTGTMTFVISPIGATNHIDFVVDDGGLEFRAINADGGGVLTTIGRKQFPQR
jgi:hypothetical protein